MEGRVVDNANFFSVEDPSSISDDHLYDLLIEEYPKWVEAAFKKGLILGQNLIAR
ncbi:VWA domain-containing protein [Ectobacillus panaciterrae]|uniref:VWA domain-containing protein n=1 Tax=Ectobacillus panaciterrae TaxID=363872 RepID=UPI000413C04B|nr:VWA domain-containing protein [Ectobacillus panaciterrae]